MIYYPNAPNQPKMKIEISALVKAVKDAHNNTNWLKNKLEAMEKRVKELEKGKE